MERSMQLGIPVKCHLYHALLQFADCTIRKLEPSQVYTCFCDDIDVTVAGELDRYLHIFHSTEPISFQYWASEVLSSCACLHVKKFKL